MSDNSSAISGALGGAAMGAEIGSVIPGFGTALGALAGATIGVIGGAKKQKAVDTAMATLQAIPNVDPTQIQFKDQLIREKKMVQSGFSTDFQVARDIIGQSEAGGMSVAAELARTNPALALMTMNQVGNQTDMSVNKSLGTLATKSMGYTSMISDMIDKIAQRKIDVDLMKAEQSLTVANVNKKDFNQNALAAMMRFGPSALKNIPGLDLDKIFGSGNSFNWMGDAASPSTPGSPTA